MDDDRRLLLSYEAQDRLPVANVHAMMTVARNFSRKSREDPARISFRAKERGALIIVQPGYSKAISMEVAAYLRSNQAAGAGDQGEWGGRHEIHYGINSPGTNVSAPRLVTPDSFRYTVALAPWV